MAQDKWVRPALLFPQSRKWYKTAEVPELNHDVSDDLEYRSARPLSGNKETGPIEEFSDARCVDVQQYTHHR